ncbi:uncharacterized protein [Elaeis guineensis]|uniref:Uncharacterized protein LOC105055474 isoform X3 n=1 Tax=Elaeis guineensis var. tenera TaxID=51953 RepID=A0A6I9S0L8_ELAGV|nr:uncharacterized protein LOC105055474 isoform X3 [Elaeis guineensis]XP_010935610.1 uncharacterized protein LOC105055474 isoform X3 [Elaeis guineensis]
MSARLEREDGRQKREAMLTWCCFSTSPPAISFASSVHEALPSRRHRILLLPRPLSGANNLLFSHHPSDNNGEGWAMSRVAASRTARTPEEDEEEDGGEEENEVYSERAKGSGTTARGRRLLKVREEKRKREYDRLHNYPTWAKILENACKDDEELRAVLGDSIGNPELMRKRELICTIDRLRRGSGRKVETFASPEQDQFLPSKSALETLIHLIPTYGLNFMVLHQTVMLTFLVVSFNHGMSWDAWVLLTLQICSWQTHQWITILCMILTKLLELCLHLSMILAMLSFKTTGAGFGWTLEHLIFLLSMYC